MYGSPETTLFDAADVLNVYPVPEGGVIVHNVQPCISAKTSSSALLVFVVFVPVPPPPVPPPGTFEESYVLFVTVRDEPPPGFYDDAALDDSDLPF